MNVVDSSLLSTLKDKIRTSNLQGRKMVLEWRKEEKKIFGSFQLKTASQKTIINALFPSFT